MNEAVASAVEAVDLAVVAVSEGTSARGKCIRQRVRIAGKSAKYRSSRATMLQVTPGPYTAGIVIRIINDSRLFSFLVFLVVECGHEVFGVFLEGEGVRFGFLSQGGLGFWGRFFGYCTAVQDCNNTHTQRDFAVGGGGGGWWLSRIFLEEYIQWIDC